MGCKEKTHTLGTHGSEKINRTVKQHIFSYDTITFNATKCAKVHGMDWNIHQP